MRPEASGKDLQYIRPRPDGVARRYNGTFLPLFLRSQAIPAPTLFQSTSSRAPAPAPDAHAGDRTVTPMIDRTRGAETTRTRTVRELHELIEALDRRLPQVQRAGETSIARAAAALKAEALRRIEELERDPTPDAGSADVR